MEKEGSREGVVSVAEFLPSTQWGYPGFGGGERVLEVCMCIKYIPYRVFRARGGFCLCFGCTVCMCPCSVLNLAEKIREAYDTLRICFRTSKYGSSWVLQHVVSFGVFVFGRCCVRVSAVLPVRQPPKKEQPHVMPNPFYIMRSKSNHNTCQCIMPSD